MKRVIVTVLIAAVSLGALVLLNRSLVFHEDTSLIVPDVTGLSIAHATAKLHRAELLTGTLEAVEDKAPVGTVLQQNVQPGAQAVPTTPVGLVVSAGPDPQPNDARVVVVGTQCDVQATPPPRGRPKCSDGPLYAAFLFNPPASPSPAPSPSP